MSFGWSAGDIVAAISLLLKIGQALRESGGAASDYQETSVFLEGLGATLEKLKTYHEDHTSQDRLGALQPEINAVQEAVKSFNGKIYGRFERALGEPGGGGWKRIFNGPQKVHYALFVSKEAKSLLEKIATPLRSIQINIGIETRGAVSDLQSVVTRIESSLILKSDEESSTNKRKLMQQVGQWLSPVPSGDDLEGVALGLRSGTCEWIFKKPEFSRWMENSTDANAPPLFWISGAPGSGKSYLATRIIQKLRDLYPLAYFYCDVKNEQKRSVLNILRTWTWQLLQRFPEGLAQVADIYFRGALPSVASMCEALRCLASIEDGCRLVLDGLDECNPTARRELFGVLPEILSHSKVLVVSRHESDISLGISKSGKNKGFASIRVSEADNRNDIIGYLQDAVVDMDLGDKDLEQRVFNSLQKNAKGMFLWTRLMIEDLSVPGRSIEEYESALQDLPKGLDEVYGRILDNLHSNSARRERSRQLFQWLACARRPLKIGELKAALSVGIDEEHIQPKKMIPNFAATLRLCCGPLVDIDSADETITLIHASVKDFLLSTPDGSLPYSSMFVESTTANAYIARSCLTYLCFHEIGLVDVNEDLKTSLQKLDAHLDAWSFLKYAVLNWYLHLKVVYTTSPEAISSFRRLYSSHHNTIKWLQMMSRLLGDRGVFQSSPAFKLIDLLKAFQSTSPLRNDTTYQQWLEHLSGPRTGRFSRWRRFMHSGYLMCSPALHISAFFDFDVLVNKLIQERNLADFRDHVGGTALHQAARADAVEVTKLLLSAGASIDAQDQWGKFPLMYAINWEINLEHRSGTFEVASILINSGADVCLKDQHHDTALTYACVIPLPEDDHILSLVTLLLDHGATKIINWGMEGAPVNLAGVNDSIRMLRTLLRYGAYVDAGPANERNEIMLATPLVKLCERKDCKAIPILIEAGANVHARDYDGRTSLHKTARINSYNASRLLLERGADVNVEARSDGSMPIHEAVRENHVKQIELFLLHNTKLEVQDSSGRTPLDIAVDNKCATVVSLLLKAGANTSRIERFIEIDDKKFEVTIRPQKQQPETQHDLYHVFWILTRELKKPLPRSIVAKIIMLAEYWLKSKDSRSDYLSVSEKEVGPVYLKTRPIQARPQKIAFTIESHDQGFSSSPAHRDTYNHSWTWFEVAVFDASGSPVALDDDEKKLQVNVHASIVKRKHVVVYGHGQHMRQAGWFEKLKQGDVIGVVPKAKFPAWRNHVYAVQIEIYTSCLLE